MVTRRNLLKTAALSLGGALVSSGLPGLALGWTQTTATGATDPRFIFIILRGAMDGLAAVPPYGDPAYRPARGSIAIDPPGGSGGALKLDDLFGLHPAFQAFKGFYDRQELAIIHAVASPYRQRSHFDGQNALENGTAIPYGQKDGWLNRAIGAEPRPQANSAMALGQNVPLVLRGARPVASWAPSALPLADDDTLARLQQLYQSDAFFAKALAEALSAQALASKDDAGMMPQSPGNNGGRRPGGGFPVLARAAGKFLTSPGGPRIASIDYDGWDTHANQGGAKGLLAGKFAGLDAGLGLLAESLGEAWRQTVVVMASEFGRTVRVNGTGGTDHGTASAVFVAGGAVAGGRVIARWPGLAVANLYQGRDLAPTTDLRAVLKGVLRDHLGMPGAALDQAVFPGSGAIPATEGLIRS